MKITDLIATIVGLCLLAALLASPVACTMKRHQAIAESIKAGADPIAAKCAIESENSSSPLCMALAARK